MSVLNEIEQYLDKVCKDKELKLYALSYCIDILNANKDKTLTKQDFETLTVDNEEVEQDIVKTLFRDKTTVSFEEVFVETLKQNLKSIDFMPEKDNLTCALYNTHYKTITVIDKEKWYPKTEKKKERIKILKNSLKNKQPLKFESENSLMSQYQNDIYHELSHMIERKSFLNGKFFKVGINDAVFIDGITNNALYTLKVNSNNLELEDINDLNPKTYYLYLKILGFNGILEIYNQCFSYKLQDKFNFYDGLNSLKYSNFLQKTRLEGSSLYERDYDVYALINLLCSDLNIKEIKFNSKPIIEKLYNLNLPAYKQRAYIDKVLSITATLPGANFVLLDSLGKTYNEVENVYSLLCCLLGEVKNVTLKNINSTHIQEYKTVVQDLLIEGVKNEWKNKFDNKNIVKDIKFFEELNNALETIDKILLYPKGKTEYYKENEITKEPIQVATENAAILPLETIAKKSQLEHINTFYEFVCDARLMELEYKDKIDGLKQTMTFLRKQDNLDFNFKLIKLQHNSIVIKQQQQQNLKQKEEKVYEN